MLGEQEATVLAVKPLVLYTVTYYDVTVGFPDRSVEQARLGHLTPSPLPPFSWGSQEGIGAIGAGVH